VRERLTPAVERTEPQKALSRRSLPTTFKRGLAGGRSSCSKTRAGMQ
jgi:hypothetical protein